MYAANADRKMSFISKKIDLILNLLNEDTCGSVLTFEQISNEFHRQIAPEDYLHLGNTLVLLLQNVDLIPNAQQRLIIFYLLIDMYRNERLSFELNPFASVFLSVLQADNDQISPVGKHFHWMIPSGSKSERAFIRLLINNPPKDLFKKTPNEILHMELSTSMDRMGQLKEKMDERKQELPFLVQCHLPAVISDPEINKVCEKILIEEKEDSMRSCCSLDLIGYLLVQIIEIKIIVRLCGIYYPMIQ